MYDAFTLKPFIYYIIHNLDMDTSMATDTNTDMEEATVAVTEDTVKGTMVAMEDTAMEAMAMEVMVKENSRTAAKARAATTTGDSTLGNHAS